MCDEFTVPHDWPGQDRRDPTRRDFAALGGLAVVGFGAPALAAGATLAEQMVDITTSDGKADAFFVHPANGRHPAVILWPDILGLREANKAMARRLAAEGYAVLVVNPYYRSARGPLGLDFAAFRTPEGRQKLAPLMPALTPDAIGRDGAAYVAFLDAQRAVDTKRGVGVQGYCFSGPFAIRTAAAAPTRVVAAATFHGGGLVTDKPDSPHRVLAQTKAAFLIAIAQNDDAKAPADKDMLAASAKAAGRPAEIEVYRADHGWCVPDSPSYDQAEADRAWARLRVLYAKL